EFGVDYSIVAVNSYHTYALEVLPIAVSITNVSLLNNLLTVTANNKFGIGAPVTLSGLATTFLNTQVVTVTSSTGSAFTANFSHSDLSATADNGTASGTSIQDGQEVQVSYNKFALSEHLSLITDEPHILNGTLPTSLNNL